MSFMRHGLPYKHAHIGRAQHGQHTYGHIRCQQCILKHKHMLKLYSPLSKCGLVMVVNPYKNSIKACN
jgi:hypothetical protein